MTKYFTPITASSPGTGAICRVVDNRPCRLPDVLYLVQAPGVLINLETGKIHRRCYLTIEVIASSINELLKQFENSRTRKSTMANNPWITDRRPTEDDAWGDKVGHRWIVVYGWLDRPGLARLSVGKENSVPWQPVPSCLRVAPKRETCEGCEHYQDRDGVGCCWHTLRFDPIPGMSGCVLNDE